MSVTFTKLFTSITESTVWFEPDSTRLVWITMLAMADRKGRVFASTTGLAHRARVTEEQLEAALECFLSPDTKSRTKDHEGRRIIPIDGGWMLLNHEKYRSIRDEEVVKESKRKYAAKKRKEEKVEKVEQSRPSSTAIDRVRCNAEAEAEADPSNKIPTGSMPVKSRKAKNEYQAFMDAWNNNLEGTPFPKINTIAGKRKKTIAARLKDYPNLLDMIVPVINYMSGIEFFTGQNKFEWVANFDYLMQDGKLNELYEKANTGFSAAKKEPDAIDRELAQMRLELANAGR